MFRINQFVIACFFGSALASLSSGVGAASILETKQQLKQLDSQIHQLKETLSHSQDKRGILNQELAVNEKMTSLSIQEFTKIQQSLNSKQREIPRLKQQMTVLNQSLAQQQNILAQHVKARYKMGEYRPLIIALNQNNPEKINQILTYYQYVLRLRQQNIDKIQDTENQLNAQKQTLESDIAELTRLQHSLHDKQENLANQKHYHQVLIQSLSASIQSQQEKLSEFELNKANLSKLLNQIAQESQARQIVQPKQPFVGMRHHLPLPVNVQRQSIQSVSQGVTFFAAEGTPVKAVYPGRVVFSDWLNGYGLLLIIDHGQGFMTLYAHNQALFKKKGSQVMQGEQIATIGHSGGGKQNGLYFEVRQRGKVTPALQWLASK